MARATHAGHASKNRGYRYPRSYLVWHDTAGLVMAIVTGRLPSWPPATVLRAKASGRRIRLSRQPLASARLHNYCVAAKLIDRLREALGCYAFEDVRFDEGLRHTFSHINDHPTNNPMRKLSCLFATCLGLPVSPRKALLCQTQSGR